MPCLREQCRVVLFCNRFAILFLWCFSVAYVAQIQIPGQTPLKFRQRVWTREDGLPNNSIRAIHQTKDGFLWIATASGLARFDGIRFKVFNTRNTEAFQRDECKALAEDQNGGLWVGTSQGLLRKQNGEWTRYTTEDSLWHNDITTLLATSSGEVWIGTVLGPVRFFNGEFKRFPPREPLLSRADEMTFTFYEDRNGFVWIGSVAGPQKWDFDTESLTDEFVPVEREAYTKQFAEDSNGNLWILGHFLRSKDDTLWNKSAKTQIFPSASISCVFTDRSGAMWVAARGFGLVHWDDGRISARPKGIVLPDDRVSCMFEDSEGSIWVGTETSGLIQLRPRRFRSFTVADGLKDGDVWSVCERRDGSIWIGTKEGINFLGSGYDLRENGFLESEGIELSDSALSPRKGDPLLEEFSTITWNQNTEGAVRVLYEDSSDVLWIGINAWENVVRTILEDSSGEIWAGTQFGLYRWHDQHWSLYTTDDGIPEDDIRALVEDKTGALWIGTFGGGLCRWNPPKESEGVGGASVNPKAQSTTATAASIPRFRIITREIKEGANSAHERKGRAELDIRAAQQHSPTTPLGVLEHLTFTTRDSLCDNNISALHMDADEVLWIGTISGLNRLDTSGVAWSLDVDTGSQSADPDSTDTAQSSPVPKIVSFTTENGLLNNTIHQIVEDDLGQLWIGSTHGIFRVAKKELNAVAGGKAWSVQCVGYDESDGLYSSEVNAGKNQPGAIKARDGRLWFPTTKGVVVIDPQKTCPTEEPLSVYIEQIRFNGLAVFEGVATGTSQLTGDGSRLEVRDSQLQIAAGSGGSLEIQFAAPTFTAPRDLRFKHRLEGYDNEWREAGNERSAHYTNLRPGSYRFQVIARNHHGVWNDAGAGFAFFVAPRVYETWWFRCAGLILVCASGTAAYLRRIGQLRKIEGLKRSRAVVEERERIARDMHDELGSRLSLLGMRCDLAQQKPPGAQGDSGSLDEIQRLVRDAERSLDQIVWAVQPDKETLSQLADYLGQYANELLEPSQVSLRLVFPETIPNESLDVSVRHNLFLGAKEALRNALQYSGASEIRIVLRVTLDEIQFEINDNGIGFESENAAIQRAGNGLLNMRKRMESIGGRFAITSSPGSGTTILFIVQLNTSRVFRKVNDQS